MKAAYLYRQYRTQLERQPQDPHIFEMVHNWLHEAIALDGIRRQWEVGELRRPARFTADKENNQ